MMTQQEMRAFINKKLVERETAHSQVLNTTQDVRHFENQLKIALEIQTKVQEVAKQVQQRIHDQLCPIVSRCLSAVFTTPYEFRIEFECKRGKTEPKLIFTRGGFEYDPVDESGGGVLEVAGFALRLAKLLLSKPKRRKLLILDEPFRCLNEAAFERMRELLQMLADELKMQFIIITHEQQLRVGREIEI